MDLLLMILWAVSLILTYSIGEREGARKEHEKARYLLNLAYRDQVERGRLNDKLQEKDDG